MKIVINREVGAFNLSDAAARHYLLLSGRRSEIDSESIATLSRQIAHQYARRSDPVLVEVVEKMGPSASGGDACLEVVDVPGTGWRLLDVCGIECVVPDTGAQGTSAPKTR
ncbi:hypothetical protein WQE_40044 [Paraburkholderia hospita]|uniref:Uncharacterized protein n=1 Tax=Paraburkholderia hospita TaxID=169430 RepID=A0ABN0F9L7_9BURK|nr:hypothetical protein [Paraburkholderia hospita]EIM95324.1 hypothetical protein WQE_40044 [Paraburkholderia hospita]OUL84684.1 hypothetical protein CA602_19445 [Paraburkholderia hospita]